MHFQEPCWRCQESKVSNIGEVYFREMPCRKSGTVSPGSNKQELNFESEVLVAFKSNHEEGLCDQLFDEKDKYHKHLQVDHLIPFRPKERLKKKCRESKIGRNGQKTFWCGFCERIIHLHKQGIAAWDERFDHVDNYHFKNGRDIKEWRELNGGRCKGGPEWEIRIAERKKESVQDGPPDAVLACQSLGKVCDQNETYASSVDDSEIEDYTPRDKMWSQPQMTPGYDVQNAEHDPGAYSRRVDHIIVEEGSHSRTSEIDKSSEVQIGSSIDVISPDLGPVVTSAHHEKSSFTSQKETEEHEDPMIVDGSKQDHQELSIIPAFSPPASGSSPPGLGSGSGTESSSSSPSPSSSSPESLSTESSPSDSSSSSSASCIASNRSTCAGTQKYAEDRTTEFASVENSPSGLANMRNEASHPSGMDDLEPESKLLQNTNHDRRTPRQSSPFAASDTGAIAGIGAHVDKGNRSGGPHSGDLLLIAYLPQDAEMTDHGSVSKTKTKSDRFEDSVEASNRPTKRRKNNSAASKASKLDLTDPSAEERIMMWLCVSFSP